jgi:hypothetical protein
MANFLVRVELHNVAPDHGDYAILHQKMSTAGFTRTVIDGLNATGVSVLPPATYSWVGDATIEQVTEGAKNAAVLTGYTVWSSTSSLHAKTFGVVVAAGDQRWNGLKPAT